MKGVPSFKPLVVDTNACYCVLCTLLYCTLRTNKISIITVVIITHCITIRNHEGGRWLNKNVTCLAVELFFCGRARHCHVTRAKKIPRKCFTERWRNDWNIVSSHILNNHTITEYCVIPIYYVTMVQIFTQNKTKMANASFNLYWVASVMLVHFIGNVDLYIGLIQADWVDSDHKPVKKNWDTTWSIFHYTIH